MNLKKSGLVILACFCFGCMSDHIEISEDQRLEINGNITNHQELNNSEILSFAGLGLTGVPNYERNVVLGTGNVDPDGNFSFMSLIPEYRQVHVVLNSDFSKTYNENFESVFIELENYDENAVDLSSLTINSATEINIYLKNSSGAEGSYRVIYTQPVRFLVYDHGVLSDYEGEYFDGRVIDGEIIPEILEVKLSSLEGEEVTVIFYYEDQQDEQTFVIQPGVNRYDIEF